MQSLKSGSLLQGGKYRIECTLGQGGFGITYLATQDILERKVAIKEFFFREYCERQGDTAHVTLGTQSNRDTVDRFLNKFIKEARTISKLHHPAIISIYDIFRENGTAYFVMEYIEGESLSHMVKHRGALPEAEALSYVRSVGDALTYIHQRNINHLDVKPSNIMLRQSDSQIVLIDFGVAKQYDEQTKEGTTTTPVGISHGYSPAEQYRKNGVQTFSPQSDVYALAATLFKLLTGQTPPEAPEIPDVGLPLEELHQRYVSESVIQSIVQAMRPRRSRTQCVADFLSNLEGNGLHDKSCRDDEETEVIDVLKPVSAPAPKLSPSTPTKLASTPLSKPAPKNKSFLTYLAPPLLCIVLCVGLIWWYVRANQNGEVTSGGKNAPAVTESVMTEVKNKSLNITLGRCVYTGKVDAVGKPHGQGEARFSNGSYYKGPFVHGVAQGSKVVYKDKDGNTYEGSFRKDKFYDGRYTFVDGTYCIYEKGKSDFTLYDRNGRKI